MLTLGRHVLRNNLFVAPMAGVTDRPFRQLCKRLGAGYAVSEMVASNAQLWASEKTRRRANHAGETAPVAVQIAGADPATMAAAARYNVAHGAQIIDINMGCPAKKVCNVAAGSALLRDEPLVARIVQAVVNAVGTGPDAVPVTLKIRTGWDRAHRNALTIARIAEEAGIAMLTVHGRTRADLYHGAAEYETMAAVKAAVRIPVVANGDITSPRTARAALAASGADALMIGRAARGRPWIFREIAHFLATGETLPPPRLDEIRAIVNAHLEDHYAFYGEFTGVRSARKHIDWYTRGLRGAGAFRLHMNTLETARAQLAAVNAFFDEQADDDVREAAHGDVRDASRNDLCGMAHINARTAAYSDAAREEPHDGMHNATHAGTLASAHSEASAAAREEMRKKAHADVRNPAHDDMRDATHTSARGTARDKLHKEVRDVAHVDARPPERTEACNAARGEMRDEARGNAPAALPPTDSTHPTSRLAA